MFLVRESASGRHVLESGCNEGKNVDSIFVVNVAALVLVGAVAVFGFRSGLRSVKHAWPLMCALAATSVIGLLCVVLTVYADGTYCGTAFGVLVDRVLGTPPPKPGSFYTGEAECDAARINRCWYYAAALFASTLLAFLIRRTATSTSRTSENSPAPRVAIPNK